MVEFMKRKNGLFLHYQINLLNSIISKIKNIDSTGGFKNICIQFPQS